PKRKEKEKMDVRALHTKLRVLFGRARQMANRVKVRWKTVPNEPIAAIGSRIPLKVGTATWLLPLMLVHPRISGPVSYVYPSVYMHQHARSDSPG
ncbi:hypothetical protein K0M31_000285, partial [Melipona bicolor]